MEIMAAVGGTPGKNCGGFCKFCYYKTIDFKKLKSVSFGCRYCPPGQIGCSNCHEFIDELNNGFKPAKQVFSKLIDILSWYEFFGQINFNNLKVITASCADIVFYPELLDLIAAIKNLGLKVHLGYTSGKGIDEVKYAQRLITQGVDEVNFSLFSTNPEIRRSWMGDKTPEESINAFKMFCENIDLNASLVVIPGVLSWDEIFNTCSHIEEWGAKSIIISRFANSTYQGLILNNRPVLDNVKTQAFEEFQNLVDRINHEFSIRVIGTPTYDPENDTPYLLSKKKNIRYLEDLPSINCEATIITSKLSAASIEKIFDRISDGKVNVVAAEKEIGDLITSADLRGMDLGKLKNLVIIPGRALVGDDVAHSIFNRDGGSRKLLRGPDSLFDYDLDSQDKDDLLGYELNSFAKLINIINSTGY